jgi:GTP-binding protein Era
MPRFGFVAIAGRPNTGNSTLLNTIAGRKLSIVTSVPQTTRHPARCVISRGDTQIAFTDLPGLAKPKTMLGRRLNEAALASVADSDAVVFLVDSIAVVGRGDAYLANRLLGSEIPVVCAVNKIDAAPKRKVVEALEEMKKISEKSESEGQATFVDFVPISAKNGLGIDTLLDVVAALLPEGPHLFADDGSEDFDDGMGLEKRIAEIIREKLISTAREELPYSIAVSIDDITTREKAGATLYEITAKILVERESQKAIVVGAGGAAIKRAGIEARRELEAMLGSQVFLDLRVVVERGWQKNPKILAKLGL